MNHSQRRAVDSKQAIITFLEGINLQSSPVELANLFTKTVEERNASRRCLSLALKTIRELESHLEEHRSILMETNAVLSEHIRGGSSYLSFLMATEPRWILDTWISFPANEKLLGVVEYKWSRGESQRALIELSSVLKGVTSSIDSIRCVLLEGAILCSCDQYVAAHSCAYEALAICERLREPKDFTIARELSGIAHFLHGKAYMAEKNWEGAYLEFSEVLSVPGYQTRADELYLVVYKNREDPPESDSEESTDSDDSSSTHADEASH
ncbi:hypothetical protein FQN49_006322 [Arthroderma sp. PD_2]|nr:hypothetical protein FQN49_006322 [Arthroderma sp. PD_2]